MMKKTLFLSIIMLLTMVTGSVAEIKTGNLLLKMPKNVGIIVLQDGSKFLAVDMDPIVNKDTSDVCLNVIGWVYADKITKKLSSVNLLKLIKGEKILLGITLKETKTNKRKKGQPSFIGFTINQEYVGDSIFLINHKASLIPFSKKTFSDEFVKFIVFTALVFGCFLGFMFYILPKKRKKIFKIIATNFILGPGSFFLFWYLGDTWAGAIAVFFYFLGFGAMFGALFLVERLANVFFLKN